MDLPLHNAIVQTIHALDRHPLHLATHLAIAGDAFFRLYGVQAELDAVEIGRRITQRLIDQGYPAQGSALVRLSLLPGLGRNEPVTVELHGCGRLLYPGYAAWHGRLRTTVTPYDCFPPGEPCLSNLLNASYAESYARMQGFDAAVHVSGGLVTGLAGGLWCCDADGVATRGGVGEYPLFFVCEGVVATPSLASGVQDSVFRRLIINALTCMEIAIEECEMPEVQLGAADEIFAATPQGPVGLRSCDGTLYTNLLSDRIVAFLPRFYHVGLLDRLN